MNNPRHNPSREKGQSLVEFAISLTMMLILLAGVVYFGIGLFYYIAMRDAAQEGALYGSMNPTDAGGIQTRVADAAGPGFIRDLYDAGQLSVNVTYTGAACEGNGITVTLQHDYSLAWLPIGAFIEPFTGSDHIRLRATVTDTILTPPCAP
jgi:Flp pilus assembly protein TadG